MTLPLIRIGQGRITAGLDQHVRLDLAAHRDIYGPLPWPTAGQLISMCEQVDLRGRGGAAFPVAIKLQAVRRRQGKRKPVIVVNGTEGEPGSSKDKLLLARSPHLVLDGAMIAARALGATQVIVAVAGRGPHVRSVSDAAAADSTLRRMVRVVSVPDRFVSGESGALVNALSGGPALPPGTKTRATDSGVRGRSTLLSNAETFAQLAVLAMLGPAGYATAGDPSEPGTVLLTVGGSVQRPAVVETPTGLPLGHILDICGAQPSHGVLVGGYHGKWLTPDIAYDVPVSRLGLQAGGGTLGAGVVLVLGEDSCPLGEVARVAGYLATQSSGQCGPCKLGLPAVAASLSALSEGAGGIDELEAVRAATFGVRGRGACHHPDGTANFVASALDVFAQDLNEHMFRGGCGRSTLGILPFHAAGEQRLVVDWTRCQGHGLCGRLLPELVRLDENGYPRLLDVPVPFWLSRDAGQAVDMCPALALRLTTEEPERPAAVGGRNGASRRSPAIAPADQAALSGRPFSGRPVSGRPVSGRPVSGRPALTGRVSPEADLQEATAWIAELGGRRVSDN